MSYSIYEPRTQKSKIGQIKDLRALLPGLSLSAAKTIADYYEGLDVLPIEGQYVYRQLWTQGPQEAVAEPEQSELEAFRLSSVALATRLR